MTTKIDKRYLPRHCERKNLARSLALNEKEIFLVSQLLRQSIRCIYTERYLPPSSYSLIKNDTLNVGSKIFEIIPIEYSKSRRVIHIYKRIKIEQITAERLTNLYRNLNFKSLPSIVDLGNYLFIYYAPKPPIFLSKSDGRLYSLQGDWDLAEAQHQASLVMRVLATFELIEEHRRKAIPRRVQKCKL